MTFKNFLQAVFAKVHNRNMAVSMSRESRALFHWKIIAVAFLLSVTLVFISSFLIYRDINLGEFFPVEKKVDSNLIPVTTALLGKTVSDFKTKSATFDQFRKNSAVSVDPSR